MNKSFFPLAIAAPTFIYALSFCEHSFAKPIADRLLDGYSEFSWLEQSCSDCNGDWIELSYDFKRAYKSIQSNDGTDIQSNTTSLALNYSKNLLNKQLQFNIWVNTQNTNSTQFFKDDSLRFEWQEEEVHSYAVQGYWRPNSNLTQKIGIAISSVDNQQEQWMLWHPSLDLAFGFGHIKNTDKFRWQLDFFSLNPPNTVKDYLFERELYEVDAQFTHKVRSSRRLWLQWQPEFGMQTRVEYGKDFVQSEALWHFHDWMLSGGYKKQNVNYLGHLTLNSIPAGQIDTQFETALRKVALNWRFSPTYQTGMSMSVLDLKSWQFTGQLDLYSEVNKNYQSDNPFTGVFEDAAMFALLQTRLWRYYDFQFNSHLNVQTLEWQNHWQRTSNHYGFTLGYKRLDGDLVQHKAYSGKEVELVSEIENWEFLALEFSWRKLWQNWEFGYQVSQLIPISMSEDKKSKPNANVPINDKKDQSSDSEQLKDWPSGHSQQLYIRYYF